MYLENDINLKLMKHIFVSGGKNEWAAVKIECKSSRNVLIACCYRTPSCVIKWLNRYLQNVFIKVNTENKFYFVISNINLYCLEYKENLEIWTFCNWIFGHACIPLIMRQTKVTPKTVYQLITLSEISFS